MIPYKTDLKSQFMHILMRSSVVSYCVNSDVLYLFLKILLTMEPNQILIYILSKISVSESFVSTFSLVEINFRLVFSIILMYFDKS